MSVPVRDECRLPEGDPTAISIDVLMGAGGNVPAAALVQA
jgi:hypothetical protein